MLSQFGAFIYLFFFLPEKLYVLTANRREVRKLWDAVIAGKICDLKQKQKHLGFLS